MSETTEIKKGSAAETETGAGESTEKKTYTEEEVQRLLQQEGDRRVSQALKKQKQELETKAAEAEKLRNMDEAQRKEYEYECKVKELEEREHEFNLTQNKLEATKVLANRGLPIDFVSYIVAEDADTMMENINTFEKAFKAAVADEVAKKISSPPPKGGSASQKSLTRDEFKKLNLQQQAEIYRTNPELYRQLTQSK